MSISVSEDLIGKKVCYVHVSVVTGNILSDTRTVTAYMVLKEMGKLRAKVRLDNGAWEYAKNLYYPQDEEKAIAGFKARFVDKVQK